MAEVRNPSKKTTKPLSAKHEKFCQLIASGSKACDAYREAGYKCNKAAASANAAKLLGNAKIILRIKEIRAKACELSDLSKADAIRYLTRIIHTPIGDLTEKSDLVQEFTQEALGANVLKTKIKMCGKLEALKQLAALCGWNAPEKIEVESGPVTRSSIEEAIARLRIESPLIRRKLRKE
jgi:hypothetical protein